MGAQAPEPQAWGTVKAYDARALIAFLTALGFEETVVHAEGDHVAYAQLDWPEGGGVMLASFDPDGVWTREPGTAGFHVVATDPAAVHDRAVTLGAEVIVALGVSDYGSTTFSLRDPEGNLWSFGTYAGEPRRPSAE